MILFICITTLSIIGFLILLKVNSFRNKVFEDWPNILSDFLLLTISVSFAYFLFQSETKRIKNDERENFKGHYTLTEIEVAENCAELNNFFEYISSNSKLPVTKPQFTNSISKIIMEDPLVLKYSGFAFITSNLQYNRVLNILSYYIEKIYSSNTKNTLTLEQKESISFLYNRSLRQMLVYRLLLHFYSVGYNANVLGPSPINSTDIMAWVRGENLPNVDSLHFLIKDLDNKNSEIGKKLRGCLSNVVN